MTETETFLKKLSEELDITDEDYERAEQRYMDIGAHLQREGSRVKDYGIDIHPQGSFAMGTIVRPIDTDEHYDVDLICLCDLDCNNITQKKLKNDVGYEVRTYRTAKGIKKDPQEGRRNWSLEYADGAQFHMDILPAIPDKNRMGKQIAESYIFKSFSERDEIEYYSQKAISITDMEHPSYHVICSSWLSSNPVGYREWFFEQMKTAHRALMESRAKAFSKSIENIPKHTVKTPLQRVVQILKRHRDMMFGNDDDKPISIIITTLAARSYDNNTSLLQSFQKIIFDMRKHIEERDGIKWVQNPVNPLENFADKWPTHPKRQENFYEWLDKVEEDFSAILHLGEIDSVVPMLEENFGPVTVKSVLAKMNKSFTPVTAANKTLAVPHRRPMQWSFQARYGVSIIATHTKNGFKKTPFKSGERIEKGLSLEFVANTGAKKSLRHGKLQYYWQIVNTGREATLAGGLRGEFIEGTIIKGSAKRQEKTLYTGSHWIECFIVHNGVCVGRSGEFLVNIS